MRKNLGKYRMKSRLGTSLMVLVVLFMGMQEMQGQMEVRSAVPVEEAVNAFKGRGIRLKNIRYTGTPQALGTYSHQGKYPAFQEGIILSTGNAADFSGPNDKPKASTVNGSGGDRDLTGMAGTRTFDMAAIDFDFMTDRDSVSFSFYFASEEYNEFVGSTFNDVFAIVVTGPGLGQGKNLAVVPGTKQPIHINSVSVHENRRYFRDNNPFTLNGSQDDRLKAKLSKELLENCQFDGMTRPISAGLRVKPMTKYHLKVVIADAGDGTNDSAVLLEAGSFESEEQYWRVLRRRQIEEQRIADSIARADSIAAVIAAREAAIRDSIRQDSIARVEAELAQQQEEQEEAAEEDPWADQANETSEGRPVNPNVERPNEVDNEVVEVDVPDFEAAPDEPDEPEPELKPEPPAGYHSPPALDAPEVKVLFEYTGDDYFVDESEDALVDRLAAYLKNNPSKKAGLFTPDVSQNADLRYDILRTDLIKAGIVPTRIFRNGFSFLSPGETAKTSKERLEVWIR